MGDPSGPAISVHALAKSFRVRGGLLQRVHREEQALKGIDLQIERGELFGFLGPNGAGKTTTVKILTTLLLPTSGTAQVLGRDVTSETQAIREHIGFVFGGERGLYNRLSGMDNLRYFADLYRIPPKVARRRIAELLARLGLAGRERDRVEQYSRGMKQRLHIARGLLNDPEVLFLDEPTIGLDPVGARELRQLVRELAGAGKTIFLTTHYMLEADSICDRIAVINHGSIVAEGTPASLKNNVAEVGVVEFEVEALAPSGLEKLRALDGIRSVATLDREMTVVVTVQCREPGQLVAQLPALLDGVSMRSVAMREATLEDAYVALVSG